MSSFHCLDRISPSGRCKHSSVWKVRVQGNFYYFFVLQSTRRSLYCPYLWFSGAPCSLKSPKELPFEIITPAVLYGSQLERGLEFPPLLMRLFVLRLFFFFKFCNRQPEGKGRFSHPEVVPPPTQTRCAPPHFRGFRFQIPRNRPTLT